MAGDDSQLVRRCLRGRQDACEALYRRLAPAVAVYLRRSGFDAASCDDLAQDVFLRLFRSLGRFDASLGTLEGYVAAIARNVARDAWARRPAAENFDPALAQEVWAAGDDLSPETREALSALGACVAALPVELAGLVRLRYVEGLTTRGVAERAGLAEATVRLRLAAAHEALRACLRGKGIGGLEEFAAHGAARTVQESGDEPQRPARR